MDDVLGRCEIHTIKRYKKSPNEIDQFEHVNYLESKSNGTDTKSGTSRQDYVSYSSSSRYDYIGIDEKGRSHFLSNDWIELNFRNTDKQPNGLYTGA